MRDDSPIRQWYQLRNAIGPAAAQRLIELEGGNVIHLAKTREGRINRHIAALCGESVSEACRRRMAGGEMRIPTGRRQRQQQLEATP